MKGLHLLFRPSTIPAKTLPSSHKPSSKKPTESHIISLIHSSKSIKQLRQIHAQIFRHNLFLSSYLTTQIISSSSLLKSTEYSLSVFNNFSSNKNTYLFNALIRGLTENSRFQDSMGYFSYMLKLNIRPDRLTYPFVLKSVASLGSRDFGRALHCLILKCGNEFDTFVRICLVDMYTKVEEFNWALKVFDESTERNKSDSILLWNVIINGCCKAGDLGKALEIFETMPERNPGSWNSLINGCMKNGDLKKANEVFEKMPGKNVISWTTMVNGFSQNEKHEKALAMFFRMLDEGMRANYLTIVSALSACAKMGALEAGVRVHNYISSNGFKVDGAIGTSLVDMYAKCGNIEAAYSVFSEMQEKNLLTWTSMMWGWAIHGRFEQAIQCFKEMMYSGIKPDGIVFLAVLTACTHSGQVDLGLNFFNSMRCDYFIEPTMKHYTLIVDMLGRAGRLDEALKFVERMPITPDFVIWGALFCACRAHKNIKLAELASQKLLQLEPKHPGSYVFLSNIYAAAGRWDDVERVRTLMECRSVEKDPGWSYIEMDCQVHSFVAGDKSHKHVKEIYMKLEEIVGGARQEGYMPGTEWVLHNIEEEEKEDALGSHSEKLALAYGLLQSAPGTIIRIVKNLRICGDCHSLMKYASKMSRREIILRDIKRFHHFKDGACSCGDYW